MLSSATIWAAVQEHPYIAGTAAGVTALGLGTLAYRLTRAPEKKEAKMNLAEQVLIDRQNRTKEVLDRLLITEYNLPSAPSQKFLESFRA